MALSEISSLYKFCSTNTALKILNSGSLRWSATHLFADPFELHHDSEPDFNAEKLLAGLITQVTGMLFSKEPPKGRHNKLINAICRWREENRFASEEEVGDVLSSLLGQMVEQRQGDIDEYLSQWRTFASKTRVVCFAEKHTELENWTRYADNHTGVALRFACGNGTSLEKPVAVNYSKSPAFVTSMREQLDIIFDRSQPPTPKDFPDKLLQKNASERHLGEWRCLDIKDEDEEEAFGDTEVWYENKPFEQKELQAIYFGVNCSETDRQQILAVAKERYPRAHLYSAAVTPGQYNLNFNTVEQE